METPDLESTYRDDRQHIAKSIITEGVRSVSRLTSLPRSTVKRARDATQPLSAITYIVLANWAGLPWAAPLFHTPLAGKPTSTKESSNGLLVNAERNKVPRAGAGRVHPSRVRVGQERTGASRKNTRKVGTAPVVADRATPEDRRHRRRKVSPAKTKAVARAKRPRKSK